MPTSSHWATVKSSLRSPRLTLSVCVAAIAALLLLIALVPPPQIGAQTSSVLAGTCRISGGANTPEGAVRGKVCDLFLRTNGGAGTTIYVKESGTNTTTGWVAATTGVLSSNLPKLDAVNVFTALGLHQINVSGAGAVGFTVRNTAAGTTNASLLRVGNDAFQALASFEGYSSTYTPVSAFQSPNGGALRGNGGGGLAIAVTDAAATIRFYTNTLLRGLITAAGEFDWDGLISADSGYKERGRTVAMGEWTTQPFSAGEYTANGSMSWSVDSGDVVSNSYSLVGKTLNWALYVGDTTVGGTPNTELRFTLPGSLVAAAGIIYPAKIIDNGGAVEDGQCYTTAASSTLNCQRAGLANFSASTNATAVRPSGVITIAVQ